MVDFQRVRNGLRKVSAGLRPFNESVWPGVQNDLFVAHESIYGFASRFAAQREVLDAGCGTGYGSALLGQTASLVTGVDIDRLSLRYARRKYESARVHFAQANLEELSWVERFDLVIASNSLEHLARPERFLSGAKRALRRSGTLVVAVPPIYTEHDIEAHGHIHYHRANFTVRQWLSMISDHGFQVLPYLHLPSSDRVKPDFSAGTPSRLSTSDFTFVEVPVEELGAAPSITALFVARAGG